ncbi:MAG: hypothetical protein JXB05_30495 [Myxococcaceae bacterium]|nr:hypothetical protein [Myxococcaceae bacterium]
MTPLRTLVLSALLFVCAATSAVAKEKKSTRSARTSAAGKSAEKGPQWVEKSDPKGFTLKVPRDSTEKRDEWSTSYAVSLAPDAARIRAVVNVEALDEFTAVTSLEKAVESILAKRPGGRTAPIEEQRELPNGYLVVIGPEYDSYAVHVIRNGKEIQLKAQCSGPSSRLAELKTLCMSVKPTK